jgi:hypothetical protein
MLIVRRRMHITSSPTNGMPILWDYFEAVEACSWLRVKGNQKTRHEYKSFGRTISVPVDIIEYEILGGGGRWSGGLTFHKGKILVSDSLEIEVIDKINKWAPTFNAILVIGDPPAPPSE